MPEALIRKLEQFIPLMDEDRRVLERATRGHIRHIAAHEDIIREGDRPTVVNLFISGWACRYKMLDDGRRQIMAYFVPGDLCDLNVFILRQMDHSIAALNPAIVAEISRDMMMEITTNHPRITQALWWATLVSEAIQREWTLNIGQRSASERVAHLFCELFHRLRIVGLTSGNTCEMPVTQAELADTTGLSTVHVNRTLQDLRASGLIVLKGRELTIPDLAALERASLFNVNYLHLDRNPRTLPDPGNRGLTASRSPS